jgi:hypothetical protein
MKKRETTGENLVGPIENRSDRKSKRRNAFALRLSQSRSNLFSCYFCIFSTNFGTSPSTTFFAASSKALNAPFSNVSLIPFTLFMEFL